MFNICLEVKVSVSFTKRGDSSVATRFGVNVHLFSTSAYVNTQLSSSSGYFLSKASLENIDYEANAIKIASVP